MGSGIVRGQKFQAGRGTTAHTAGDAANPSRGFSLGKGIVISRRSRQIYTANTRQIDAGLQMFVTSEALHASLSEESVLGEWRPRTQSLSDSGVGPKRSGRYQRRCPASDALLHLCQAVRPEPDQARGPQSSSRPRLLSGNQPRKVRHAVFSERLFSAPLDSC